MADDFASTMRELSAAAVEHEPDTATQLSTIARELRTLNAGLRNLESVMTLQFENVATNLAPMRNRDAQFRRIEEQLAAIRASESVNQRLFDSLHAELLKYRDNFVHESLQKPVVRDLILLFDDLTGLAEQLTAAAEENSERVVRWRENLQNAIHALSELLNRLEVTEIEAREFVDRGLHKVVSFEPCESPHEDGRIVARTKRGFIWRGKVLRPEEVVAMRCPPARQ
jgi:molecular chaperone GrpE (heat shock protein)